MEIEAYYSGDAEVHFRYKIITPLLEEKWEKGKLKKEIDRISKEAHYHPGKKEEIIVSASTIERWYYLARNAKDPFSALRPSQRKDKGAIRNIDQRMAKILMDLTEEHPQWSRKLMWQNWLVLLEKEGFEKPYPSYSSILRFFRKVGFEPTPRFRTEGEKKAFLSERVKERRSFRDPFVGGLYHLDFHYASFQIPDKNGILRTPKGMAIRDNHSGYVCHFGWYFEETAEALVHALIQAFLKFDLPKKIMADNGSAMISKEYLEGLLVLGIEAARIPPYSPWKNGKIERYWQIVEKRLMAMLQQVEGISLLTLNQLTHAWLSEEYHLTTPKKRTRNIEDTFLLNESNILRKCPEPHILKKAFMRTQERKIKKQDGSISLEGVIFEVPWDFRHLRKVLVRYASWDLSEVYLVDSNRKTLARIFPQNLEANSNGKRREYRKSSQKKLEELKLPPLLEKTVESFLKHNRIPGFFDFDNE